MASPLILASASPRRKTLLDQIGLTHITIHPTEVDETPTAAEQPQHLALRLAKAKLQAAQSQHQKSFILAADTVVAVGRRILPKAETPDQAAQCLDWLSGRAHRVYTGVAISNPEGKTSTRVVETRVRFKRLSIEEKQNYLKTLDWQGKAGGYALQGRAAAFIEQIVGSPSNVIGLPLFEVAQMLKGLGFIVTDEGNTP